MTIEANNPPVVWELRKDDERFNPELPPISAASKWEGFGNLINTPDSTGIGPELIRRYDGSYVIEIVTDNFPAADSTVTDITFAVDAVSGLEVHALTLGNQKFIVDSCNESPWGMDLNTYPHCASGTGDQVVSVAESSGIVRSVNINGGDKFFFKTDGDGNVYGMDGQPLSITLPKLLKFADNKLNGMIRKFGGNQNFPVSITNLIDDPTLENFPHADEIIVEPVIYKPTVGDLLPHEEPFKYKEPIGVNPPSPADTSEKLRGPEVESVFQINIVLSNPTTNTFRFVDGGIGSPDTDEVIRAIQHPEPRSVQNLLDSWLLTNFLPFGWGPDRLQPTDFTMIQEVHLSASFISINPEINEFCFVGTNTDTGRFLAITGKLDDFVRLYEEGLILIDPVDAYGNSVNDVNRTLESMFNQPINQRNYGKSVLLPSDMVHNAQNLSNNKLNLYLQTAAYNPSETIKVGIVSKNVKGEKMTTWTKILPGAVLQTAGGMIYYSPELGGMIVESTLNQTDPINIRFMEKNGYSLPNNDLPYGKDRDLIVGLNNIAYLKPQN